MTDELQIRPVPRSEWASAAALLVQHLPAESRASEQTRLLAELKHDSSQAEGVLAAYRQDQLLAVCRLQFQVGRTGHLWWPLAMAGQTAAGVTGNQVTEAAPIGRGSHPTCRNSSAYAGAISLANRNRRPRRVATRRRIQACCRLVVPGVHSRFISVVKAEHAIITSASSRRRLRPARTHRRANLSRHA